MSLNDDLYAFLGARFLEERDTAIEALNAAAPEDEKTGAAYANNADSNGDSIVAFPPETAITAADAKRWAMERCDGNTNVLRALAMQYEYHQDYRSEWSL